MSQQRVVEPLAREPKPRVRGTDVGRHDLGDLWDRNTFEFRQHEDGSFGAVEIIQQTIEQGSRLSTRQLALRVRFARAVHLLADL